MRTLLVSLALSAATLSGLPAPAAAADAGIVPLRPSRVCRPVLGSSKAEKAAAGLPSPIPGCEIGKPAYVCDPIVGRPIPIPIPVEPDDPTTSSDPGDAAAVLPIDPPIFWPGREICYR